MAEQLAPSIIFKRLNALRDEQLNAAHRMMREQMTKDATNLAIPCVITKEMRDGYGYKDGDIYVAWCEFKEILSEWNNIDPNSGYMYVTYRKCKHMGPIQIQSDEPSPGSDFCFEVKKM